MYGFCRNYRSPYLATPPFSKGVGGFSLVINDFNSVTFIHVDKL